MSNVEGPCTLFTHICEQGTKTCPSEIHTFNRKSTRQFLKREIRAKINTLWSTVAGHTVSSSKQATVSTDTNIQLGMPEVRIIQNKLHSFIKLLYMHLQLGGVNPYYADQG